MSKFAKNVKISDKIATTTGYQVVSVIEADADGFMFTCENGAMLYAEPYYLVSVK